MSDNNLDIRARLTGVNELSPVLKKVIADLQKFEGVAKRVNIQLGGMGRSGMGALDGFNRAAKAATDQMRGMTNLARSAARDYSSVWSKANAQSLADSRRTYAALERLESGYQRQLARRAAVERRASSGRSYVGGGGSRLPAPNIRTLAAGAVITGAGVASALRKRMEVQAAEVRAQMFGDLDKGEIGKLRRDYADKAGIRYGIGSSKVIDTAVEGLKAGVAKQFAGEFADLALKAQAGLDVNPEAVGKLLGRLSTQMPWDTGRFSKILNAIAVANNSTAADGNEIIEAMRRSLSALATTRMTPEQLAALDSTGISLGVQPFKMGTFASFLTSQIAGADSARGQQASDLNAAANALGFGGRGGMAKTMRERPMEAIQQILDNLAKMPERLRTKVAKQIGGREWMDELLTLVLGRDKLRDVVRDIESKPGFLDKTALQKIRSMQGRWASISAALGLVWEKVGAGLETWFDQVSDAVINLADSFNFDAIREHFAALIDGAREGFGLKDWGDVVKTMADNFDARTVAKWREFGRGFAEGIREFANGLKTAFSVLGFLAGKNPADAREMGDLVAKLTGLTVALAALSPLLSVLTALTLGLTGIGNALAFIAGMPTAVALLSMFAVRNQNAGVPDANVKHPGETTSEWRERQKAHRNRLYHKSSYTGPTDFSGMRRTSDPSDDLTKFTGKVERAAFIHSGTIGGLQYASIGGARGGSGSGGLGGRSYIGGIPNLMKSAPGEALPYFGVGRSGSILRNGPSIGALTGADKVPSIGAGTLSRSAFERKFAGTALAGKYDQVIASARSSGISPALLAGIIAHETGNGVVLSGNNPGGIMDPATGMARKMKFADLDAGISKTGHTVAKNYRRAGGDLDKMGGIYAPPGAANDPRGLNGGWAAGVRKQMNALGDGAGYAGTGGDAVAWAQKYIGLNEYTDNRVLAAALGGDVRGRSNAWCARFVNKAIESAGGKGTGSAVANSFQRYGSAIDPAKVLRNDVLLQPNGRGYNQPGGHVGLATGETRMHNGRLQVKMLAGNDGDAVREHWIDADHNLMVRRGSAGLGVNVPAGVTSQVPPASVIQNVPPPVSPGVGASAGAGDVRSMGPVAIHINGSSHDPEALATLVQRRIDESMNWRTHDTASEYT
ncbi:phage tail tape measure protein [Bradyrhizobium diazoefficiens]|uniref:phage tail tape measure protein n=1 Tax=Bradyrhizobium diazoefficiens TaxID=1355477 RepID=UPI00271464A6|nr:phage tail tape measure protein [Bradyrhizobium diazoefficiens]WLB42291.1 phage tail tape measure protein [Bradyrhizobium diazoefficiens]